MRIAPGQMAGCFFLLAEKVVHSKIFYIADMSGDLNAMRCDRIITIKMFMRQVFRLANLGRVEFATHLW